MKRKPRAKQGSPAPKEVGTESPSVLDPTGGKLPCANAACLTEEITRWLWNQRVPLKELTLLAGQSEVGKSTVATALAAATTCGFGLPGGPELEQPGAVLWYASEENAMSRIKPRLRANGAVLARVFFPELDVLGNPRPRPRLPRDAGAIMRLAEEVHAKLIVIDPITSYCEDGANPDHGTVARPVCECLRDVAQAIGGAVVAIKHPKKFVPGGSPLDQISGSKEWTNVPRSVLLCAPHPEDPERCVIVPMKGSETATKAPALVYRIVPRDGLPLLLWEQEVQFTKEELLEASGSSTERDTLADAKAMLMDRLAQGEAKAKDILLFLQDAGIPVSVARKAKKLLKITSHTIGPVESRFHVWRPPGNGFSPEGA